MQKPVNNVMTHRKQQK